MVEGGEVGFPLHKNDVVGVSKKREAVRPLALARVKAFPAKSISLSADTDSIAGQGVSAVLVVVGDVDSRHSPIATAVKVGGVLPAEFLVEPV